MLHLQIDPHTGVPIYRQVMDQVRYYAASGMLKRGEQLPSIRDLAKELSINPMTVAKAYSELAHEGVVEMKQGKGVFLSERMSAPSPAECQRAMQRIARQLAVEASQMGASREVVLQIVDEELARLRSAVMSEIEARMNPTPENPEPRKE